MELSVEKTSRSTRIAMCTSARRRTSSQRRAIWSTMERRFSISQARAIVVFLLHCRNIFSIKFELPLTEGATYLYIRKNILQISDVRSKILHLTETFMYTSELLHDPVKRFTESAFQSGLEFFVHGLPHLVELGR